MRLPAGACGAVPALVLELTRADGHYEVTDLDPSLTVSRDGAPVARGDRLGAGLAELGLVRPLTTQRHFTDQSKDRITYDAATAEGGSGAPVFGPSGRVIGVGFAALREGGYSNFAVPVAGTDSLLRRAGWRPQ